MELIARNSTPKSDKKGAQKISKGGAGKVPNKPTYNNFTKAGNEDIMAMLREMQKDIAKLKREQTRTSRPMPTSKGNRCGSQGHFESQPCTSAGSGNENLQVFFNDVLRLQITSIKKKFR